MENHRISEIPDGHPSYQWIPKILDNLKNQRFQLTSKQVSLLFFVLPRSILVSYAPDYVWFYSLVNPIEKVEIFSISADNTKHSEGLGL